MKIWLVYCENEYGLSVEGIFSNKISAEQVRDFLQVCSDTGIPPIQEYCYGSYFVHERELCGSLQDWKTSWGFDKMLQALKEESHPLSDFTANFGLTQEVKEELSRENLEKAIQCSFYQAVKNLGMEKVVSWLRNCPTPEDEMAQQLTLDILSRKEVQAELDKLEKE
jgi:hypothetical protein